MASCATDGRGWVGQTLKIMASRRPRPFDDRFDVAAMVDDLKDLANLKRCGFDWEINDYGKRRSANTPNRDGLAHYAQLLKIVLKHAPGCFPNHNMLVEVWKVLQKQTTWSWTPAWLPQGSPPAIGQRALQRRFG